MVKEAHLANGFWMTKTAIFPGSDVTHFGDGVKTMVNKWRYECDCSDCVNVQHIHDPARHLDGDYCVPMVDGKPTIHADDDYAIRCDCYMQKKEVI